MPETKPTPLLHYCSPTHHPVLLHPPPCQLHSVALPPPNNPALSEGPHPSIRTSSWPHDTLYWFNSSLGSPVTRDMPLGTAWPSVKLLTSADDQSVGGQGANASWGQLPQQRDGGSAPWEQRYCPSDITRLSLIRTKSNCSRQVTSAALLFRTT